MKINKNHVKKGAEAGARTAGGILHAILKIIGTILLIVIMTGLIFTVIFASYVKNSLSSELDVNLSDFSLAQTSVIYYWNDDSESYEVLEELSGRKKSTWVSYEQIPKYMEYAAVSIEDKRFYTHHGVDWYRTIGAFGNMFLSMSDTFGGSTITQQLIKNLTEYDEVTVKRKLLEIFRALKFEKTYSKEEIMEAYLNRIYLGEGCYGIGAAAKEYFDKDVSELTIAECACIIGITNNPSMYDPYIDREANRERQEIILGQMLEQEYINQSEYDSAMAQEMVFTRGADEVSDSSSVTSWFVDALIEDVIADLMELRGVSYKVAEDLLYSAGYKIYSTIDPDIQAIVDDVYSSHDNIPTGYKQSSYQELQSAMVIIDPYTGDVVAMAGKVGEKEGSRIFNYATDMQRSPGSTIKPIASYSLAMDLGIIMPYTTYYDSAAVKLRGTDWYPNNDNYSNSGLITIRYALQRSINTIAAQLIDDVTPQVSYDFLTQKLGLPLIDDPSSGLSDNGYASLALGQLTYGVSVRDMASAYTCFANDGIRTESRTYSRIEDASGNLIYDNVPESFVALNSTTAYYMNDLLQNVVSSGTGYYAKLPNMPTAGKTGASSNWCDRWFVGYTPYYVGAVWSGYENPEYMGSSNPSTGMWRQVMERVHENLEYKEFDRPDNMKQVTVCIDTGLLATDACKNDLRGNHTMTLYMESSKIPTQYCQAHTLIELCSDSMKLPSDDCPQSSIKTYAVIDLNKAPGNIKTPPYYSDSACYNAKDPAIVEDKRIPYLLDEIEICDKHLVDPESGWLIDSTTGYLKNPKTGLLYDPATDKIYDQHSGWEIDWKTGALIDPVSGELIDPWTGEKYVSDTPVDENTPDKFDRPPNYQKPQPSTPPATEDPVTEPTDDPSSPTDDVSPPDVSDEPGSTEDPDGGSLFYTG